MQEENSFVSPEKTFAVVMAGGKGERFWPLSRAARPKQLLALTGGKPLVAEAVDRLSGLIPEENIVIVTNAALVAPIKEILGEGSRVGVVGEPVGRDTAAAVAAGAAWCARRAEDGVMCVLTADHLIGDLDVFRATLRGAMAFAAAEDALLTLGIAPREPATGYGYIHRGEESRPLPGGEGEVCKVERFVEKPCREKAEAYLAEGGYFWNSGMFVWSLRSLAAALARHCPEKADCFARWKEARDDAAYLAMLEKDYPGLEKISVDYALMEKADNVWVVPGRFSWDDVGSFPSLAKHIPDDGAGNAVLGAVEALGSAGNVVLSEGRLTALVGVEDLVVVQAEGVTLIARKDRAEEIKKLLAQLREKGGYEKLF
ncbi:MAG: mannose-1-phosphate guanylyltransferase [Kiritimatiellae bacterium]|nr:mannose-1-phosphate guanylyltransferase [Kiritimatiellia bacterium]